MKIRRKHAIGIHAYFVFLILEAGLNRQASMFFFTFFLFTFSIKAAAILNIDKQAYLIVHCKSAMLTQNKENKSLYFLKCTHPHIFYFYDRPWKEEGTVSSKELLLAWKGNFKKYGKLTYPNGVWIIEPKGEEKLNLIKIIIHDLKVQSQELYLEISKQDKRLRTIITNNFFVKDYLDNPVRETILMFSLP